MSRIILLAAITVLSLSCVHAIITKTCTMTSTITTDGLASPQLFVFPGWTGANCNGQAGNAGFPKADSLGLTNVRLSSVLHKVPFVVNYHNTAAAIPVTVGGNAVLFLWNDYGANVAITNTQNRFYGASVQLAGAGSTGPPTIGNGATTPQDLSLTWANFDSDEPTFQNQATAYVGGISFRDYTPASDGGLAPYGSDWDIRAVPSATATVTNQAGLTVPSAFYPHVAIVTAVYTYTFADPTDPPTSPPAVSGDPQFAGFQGQHFQVHGIPDEHFNIISTPKYYVNSKFVYIANGQCTYNDTECFSHPGTYISQLLFGMAGVQVKVIAGAHSAGLTVYVNDNLMSVGQRFDLPLTNTTYVHLISSTQVVVTLGEFTVGATNSDHFMNLQASANDAKMVRDGAKHVSLTIDDAAAVDKVLSTSYPEYSVHGLLGQTWRNVEYNHHKSIQGDATDYQTSSLASPEFLFSQYIVA